MKKLENKIIIKMSNAAVALVKKAERTILIFLFLTFVAFDIYMMSEISTLNFFHIFFFIQY